MERCDMVGCHDMAIGQVHLVSTEEPGREIEPAEVCEDCLRYWMTNLDDKPYLVTNYTRYPIYS